MDAAQTFFFQEKGLLRNFAFTTASVRFLMRFFGPFLGKYVCKEQKDTKFKELKNTDKYLLFGLHSLFFKEMKGAKELGDVFLY